MRIDIDQVLRQRLPAKHRYIPRWAVRCLERYVCQDRLNHILAAMGSSKGVEAAAIALRELDISVTAIGLDALPTSGRYLFASNHPLGGLDGLALIKVVGEKYGGAVRFLVNDLLMAVKPLDNVFMPINKYGRQSREAAALIEEEFAGPKQMLTFPAGLCSRRMDDGTIADLPWHKAVVAMAVRNRRDVVPVFFEAQNSAAFYRNARLRERLGIKFNAEMVMLPREMVKQQGGHFNVYFGAPVSWQSLNARDAKAEAARLRQLVYTLKN